MRSMQYQSHLRSALGYRDRGLLPRAVRQDPPQPRPGEQVVEGRLQACRCVPSRVRLRRVPGHGHVFKIPIQDWTKRLNLLIGLLDNDEALSLPYERVVGLLGEDANSVCEHAAILGSVRLLKWTRENNLDWDAVTCLAQPIMDTCPLSSTCTRTGALGTRTRALTQPDTDTCPFSNTRTRTGALGTNSRAFSPPNTNAGTACSTLVDNKCPGWEHIRRETTRSTSDEMTTIDRRLACLTHRTVTALHDDAPRVLLLLLLLVRVLHLLQRHLLPQLFHRLLPLRPLLLLLVLLPAQLEPLLP